MGRIESGLRAACFAVAAILALVPQAGAQNALKVVFPTPPQTFMIPYLIPKDSGWYEKQGLKVDEVYVNGDSTALRMLLAGDADIAILGPPTVFKAVAEGAKVKSIGSWQPIVDYQIVAANNVGTSLKDLAGKTFASGGPADFTTEVPRMMLKKHNVDTSGIKFLQVGGHAARLQAVMAGKVDATMVNTLTALKGIQDGKVRKVASVVDDFPALGYVLIVVRDQALKNDKLKPALEIFARGGILGAEEVAKDPEKGAKALSGRAPDMDAALILAVVKEMNAMKVWGYDGRTHTDVIKSTAEVQKTFDVTAREVQVNEIVDNSIAEMALKTLGRK